jgi:hypothetical protein
MNMIDPVNGESRIRYQAARRGFCVIQTRGREHERREKAGAGTYLLLDQSNNGVAIAAATLEDISGFLKAHVQIPKERLN